MLRCTSSTFWHSPFATLPPAARQQGLTGGKEVANPPSRATLPIVATSPARTHACMHEWVHAHWYAHRRSHVPAGWACHAHVIFVGNASAQHVHIPRHPHTCSARCFSMRRSPCRLTLQLFVLCRLLQLVGSEQFVTAIAPCKEVLKHLVALLAALATATAAGTSQERHLCSSAMTPHFCNETTILQQCHSSALTPQFFHDSTASEEHTSRPCNPRSRCASCTREPPALVLLRDTSNKLLAASILRAP
jgi:hypothetical protein